MEVSVEYSITKIFDRYSPNIYMYIYKMYLTEVSTPLTFVRGVYVFSCDITEEMTLCYNVK